MFLLVTPETWVNLGVAVRYTTTPRLYGLTVVVVEGLAEPLRVVCAPDEEVARLARGSTAGCGLLAKAKRELTELLADGGVLQWDNSFSVATGQDDSALD